MTKIKYLFYFVTFILLTIIGIIFLPKDEVVIINDELSISSGDPIIETIFVHIDGAVNSPGIYEIPKGTRVFELIKIAGDETLDADLSKINLSLILKDEQKLLVPFKISSEELVAENIYNKSSKSSTISINYSGVGELETLPGIGPAMAQKIVSYREENGYFNSIEEIKNVSGIGEAKYNKIKDYISV